MAQSGVTWLSSWRKRADKTEVVRESSVLEMSQLLSAQPFPLAELKLFRQAKGRRRGGGEAKGREEENAHTADAAPVVRRKTESSND